MPYHPIRRSILGCFILSLVVGTAATASVDLNHEQRSIVVGTAHGAGGGLSRRSRHRHVARSFLAGSTAPMQPELEPEVHLEKREECVYGSWSCSGNDLQRCYDGAYHTMRSCGSNLVCSTDPTQTGCIWPFQVPGYVAVDDNATDDDEWEEVCDDENEVAAAAITSVGNAYTSVTPKPSSSWSEESTSQVVDPTTSSEVQPSATPAPSSIIAHALYGAGGRKWSSSPLPSSTSDAWWTESSSSTAWSEPTPSVVTAWNGEVTSYKWRQGTSSSLASAAVPTSTSGSTAGGTVNTGSGAPHWVIYSDKWFTSMPTVGDLQGYNRFLLAFWMSNAGAVDNALFWQDLSASEQQSILSTYNAAGIQLMVSAFGSTDNPTTTGVDPTQCAQKLAAWVKANHMNGVDIDYEDNNAFNSGVAEQWLITFQRELRNQLPPPYIISHAPQAPWFTTSGQYSGGGYMKIHQQVGSTIDFYNVQFYNQGTNAYTTCDSLLFSSATTYFPGTSVFEMSSNGVELDKIVIGKPINAGAAANGYMDTSTLSSCVKQAQAQGWNAGVMYWEYDNTALSVMAAIQV